MTLASTPRRAGPFLGNGVTTSFPFTFKVFAREHVRVTRTVGVTEQVLVLDADYSVTLNPNQDASPGGAITYPLSGLPLPDGQTLDFTGAVPYDQPTDLPNGGNYRAEVVENAMDYLAMQIQQIAEGGGGGGGGGGGVDLTPYATKIDLASEGLSEMGAGMVGYGGSVPYAPGSVGAELRNAQSQVEHLWHAIRTNQRDIYIIVTGDSTGNEATEWVYLMTQWLAAQCPTHSVKYRLFDDGTTSWGSYATLQTGTGPALPFSGSPFTIHIDNGSVSGTNAFYTQGARESSFWTGIDYDLCIVNYGHNLGTAMTEYIALPEWVMALAHVRSMVPRAGLLVTLQNPRSSSTSDVNTNGSAQSARMVAAWRKAVELVGGGVIDAYTAFKTHPDYASLMADETHPSSAGSTVWLGEVKRAMAEPTRLTGDAPLGYNPLVEMRPNFAPNPRFSRWAGSAPDGWEFTNCTPVKNVAVTDGSLYSMEVQITAGINPFIKADITSLLSKFRGKTVSFLARIWLPAGLDLLAGRIAIETTDNVTNPAFTSYPRGAVPVGGWQWVFATLPIPRTPRPTAAQLRIYAGAANGSDSGKKFYIDSVWFGEGLLPAGVGFDDVLLKFVSDFYNDQNVGRFAGNTGTLTAVGGVLTLTGSPTTNSDTYINLPGLTPGKTYKVTFNCTSATGNTAGGCYMRNGFDGGSTDLAKASGTGDWVAGGGPVSFTFVAPNGPVSIRPYGYTGTTGYVMTSWVVTESLFGNVSQFPQNSRSANYTLVGSDAGKHLLHPSADVTARTFTIPANSAVDYPIGTAITFINQNAAGVLSIAINTDTMRLSPGGTTGTRSLAANGVAEAIKVTATEWIISGTGLS